MKQIKAVISFSLLSLLFACSTEQKADGYGNFEATEIRVSAEANGKLQSFFVEEGRRVEKGEVLGLVDTLQLYLKKQQLVATKAAVASKSGGVLSQIGVLRAELQNAKTEQRRLQHMFDDKAATQQQLDQVNSRVSVSKSKFKMLKVKMRLSF